MNSGSCSRENGLHQFLEPVTLCWIKEAREQNSTTLENALLRFGVSFGVRINSVRPFEANGQPVGQCEASSFFSGPSTTGFLRAISRLL